jgi:hypothetical protein
MDQQTPIQKSSEPKLRLSVEQIEELDPIGKRIRLTWDEANCLAARARETGHQAVAAALLCGQALLEAKRKLQHGQWLPWLNKHCADVGRSIDTAQNWMRLAKANTEGIRFLEANSLTAAYRMVGILPELETVGQPQQKELTVDALAKRLQWIRTASETVKSWSAEQKQAAVEQLRPLVALYHQLIPEAQGA